jgi:HD-like signal output (HDOD) protein/GGDEF domain-containing protein
MSDPATTLDRLVSRAGQLYSLPAVAMQVLELTNNPQVDTRALKDCIENDPALTGKILRIVNSSLFGLSRQVSDLNQALALLGTKPLKLLVLGFSLPPGLFAGVTSDVLGYYWRHTLTKAVAGREISETLFDVPGDDAFIAGLLQDIGMLLLIQELGEPYVRFLETTCTSGKSLEPLEAEAIGFDHTTLSARLLTQWGLPQTLVDAVGWKPSGRAPADGPVLPRVLHLAELFARLLADRQATALGELLEVGREYRRLTDAELESLVASLQEKVDQLADVLKLQLPEGLDYRDVLVQAHAQLAVAANEAAEDLLRGDVRTPARLEEESLLSGVRDLQAAAERLSHPRPAVPAAAVAEAMFAPASAAAPVHAMPSAARNQASSATASSELDNRLAVAVAACRQSRCALSLLLVELDRAEELAAMRSAAEFAAIKGHVERVSRNLDHPFKICVPHGKHGFAIILPNCERRQAVELGNELIDAFRRVTPGGDLPGRNSTSLSVGAATVALPPRNFPPNDLFDGSSRCLYGSQASGGGVVKSIEIY